MDRLREVLEQVQSGKTKFLPETATPEGLASFQPTAVALQHANAAGYLSAVFRVSKMIGTHGYVLEAIVNGPLAYKGLRYLDTPPATQDATVSTNEPDVFQIRPSIGGISIDLRAAFRWARRRLGK